MKKIIAGLILIAAATSFAAALDMSAGAGATFSLASTSTDFEKGSYSSDEKSSASLIGFKGFFDATYAEADLGMNFSVSDKYDGEDTKMSYTNLTMGILGKYPIALGSVTVFPLAGFEYDLNLIAKNDGETVDKSDLDGDEKSSLNQFWLKAGIGADVAINEKLYVRPTALFGYKLNSAVENERISDAKDANFDKNSINTIKCDIGLAVGYKL